MSVTKIGPLTVNIEERAVTRDGVPCPLGRRALALLLTLVEQQGKVVSRDAIIKSVWPDTVVEENNLQVNIVAIRKALGSDRDLVRTVPGRGYMLVRDQPLPTTSPIATTMQHCLPSGGRLFGRDGDLKEIAQLLVTHRVTSVVGAGGVGKTTLAEHFCEMSLDRFHDRIRFVSLAATADDHVANDIIDRAFGGLTDSVASSPTRTTETLLVLDNCEHLLDSVANVTSRLLAADSRVRILVTSRAPLGIAEEVVYHLSPLDVPPEEADAEAVVHYDSIRLFLHRLQRASGSYACGRHELEQIAKICRRLDGIPLALEIAANRSAAIGLDAVASRLNDRFDILATGSRNALPRHQTLRAVFDWSYSLLSAPEQHLFRYCGRFASSFSLEAAVFIMARLGYSRDDAVEAVVGLISKSLLSVDIQHEQRFRFLESTRAYAIERLCGERQFAVACRLQAEYCNQYLEDIHQRVTAPDAACRAAAIEIDNLRAALAWSFGAEGATVLGIKLASLAMPHLYDLSLLEECTRWSLVALCAIERARLSPSMPAAKLRLLSAYASGLVYAEKPGSRVEQAWKQTFDMAECQEDPEGALQAVWGLWNNAQYSGDALSALAWARRFGDLVGKLNCTGYQRMARRLLGISLHYVGAHERAREALMDELSSDEVEDSGNPTGCFRDQAIDARATLARVSWLCGDHGEAVAIADQAEILASRQGNGLTLSRVLVEATIPLAILSGNRPKALAAIEALRSLSRKAGLSIWLDCCDAFDCAATVHENCVDEAFVTRFVVALDRLRAANFLAPYPLMQLKLAVAYEYIGDRDAAVRTLDSAIQYGQRHGNRWLTTELHRARRRHDAMVADTAPPDVDLHA